MRVGKVDDRCGAEVDAEARLRVAERQLEHVVGAGEIRFAGQGGKVELHDLRRAGAAVHVRVVRRDVVRDLIAEAADDDAVEQISLVQRRIQLVCRGQTDLAAVLDLNNVPIVPGRGQIVQHLVQRQNAQLVRHGVAV